MLVLAAFAATTACHDSLPDPFPIHWNFRGQPDAFAPKPWGTYGIPAAMVGIYLLLLFFPRFRSSRVDRPEVQRAIDVMRLAVLGLFLAIQLMAMAGGLGYPINMGRGITTGIGVLFLIVGYLLPGIPRNDVIGLRFSWTQSDDTIWRRSQEKGGKVFTFAGILVLVLAGLTSNLLPAVGVMLGAGLLAVILSWLEHRSHTKR